MISLILLAIVCQLVAAPVADSSAKQQSTAITLLDHMVLAAAPQRPFACVEGKSPDYLKISGGIGKFVVSLTNGHLAVSTEAQLFWNTELQSLAVERLWLRYRTLLL